MKTLTIISLIIALIFHSYYLGKHKTLNIFERQAEGIKVYILFAYIYNIAMLIYYCLSYLP